MIGTVTTLSVHSWLGEFLIGGSAGLEGAPFGLAAPFFGAAGRWAGVPFEEEV